jgi:hypothetical protein
MAGRYNPVLVKGAAERSWEKLFAGNLDKIDVSHLDCACGEEVRTEILAGRTVCGA